MSIEGQTIGERIRAIRTLHGVTQCGILKIIGRPKQSSQSWIARIESGEAHISARELKMIAVHFKVSVDDLIP